MAGTSNRTLTARQVAGQNSLRNYIENASAHINTSGWVTYADAAQSRPVDGIGGTPNVTWSRTTTAPLSLDASFQFVKDAANRQGQGVSFDFSIDRADQAKVMEVSFDYELVSGTYDNGTSSTDSDLIVYLYDVTNSRMIEPQQFKIDAAVVGQVPQFKTTFQTSGDSTSYRLIIHVATASTSAYTLNFDNFRVSQQTVVYSSPVTDWQAFPSVAAGTLITATTTNPTYGTVVYNRADWRRVGGNMEIRWVFRQSSSGTAGSGTYLFNLPPGFVIDTSRLSDLGTDNPAGIGIFQALGPVSVWTGYLALHNSTQLRVFFDYQNFVGNIGGAGLWSSSFGGFNDTSLALEIRASVPIQGWSSNQLSSNDADQRVLVARAVGNPTNSLAFPAWNTLTYSSGAESFDTHAALDPTTGIFTAPMSGYYKVTGKASISMPAAGATTVYEIRILKNNTTVEAVFNDKLDANPGTTTAADLFINQVVHLNSGDNVRVQVRAQTATTFLSGDGFNFISFERVQGPASITSTEFIGARYTTNAGQSIPNTNAFTVINFEDKDYDTHSAVTTGSNWQFRAPAAGYYQIDATCTFDIFTWNPGNYLGLQITKTGSSTVESSAEADAENSAAVYRSIQKSDLIYMATGDVVTVRLFHNRTGGAASLYTVGGFNTIAIRRVGV